MREETLAILHETRATCIVVPHDAEEAMCMGVRVALLRKSRVAQAGSALDLYRAPKDILAARTFSDLNEVPASIEKGNAKTALGSFPANGMSDGKDATACVRQHGCFHRAKAPRRACSTCAFSATWRSWRWRCRGLDTPLLARVRESDAPAIGSEIGISIDAGAVLVFEPENGNAASTACPPNSPHVLRAPALCCHSGGGWGVPLKEDGDR
jgi:iron(III) transport system ATP-binding protein